MATKRKSAAQKALKEAAELAPLVQADQNGTDAKTSEKAAQKAAEYLLKTMGSQTGEKIVVDGITIPTQAELLNMPESDYMNEAQQAFFKHLLKEREAQLRSNAGETAEHLRENSIVPDPAENASSLKKFRRRCADSKTANTAGVKKPAIRSVFLVFSPARPQRSRLRLSREENFVRSSTATNKKTGCPKDIRFSFCPKVRKSVQRLSRVISGL